MKKILHVSFGFVVVVFSTPIAVCILSVVIQVIVNIREKQMISKLKVHSMNSVSVSFLEQRTRSSYTLRLAKKVGLISSRINNYT